MKSFLKFFMHFYFDHTFAVAIGIGVSTLNTRVLDFGSNFTSSGSGILEMSIRVMAVRFLENSLSPLGFLALTYKFTQSI